MRSRRDGRRIPGIGRCAAVLLCAAVLPGLAGCAADRGGEVSSAAVSATASATASAAKPTLPDTWDEYTEQQQTFTDANGVTLSYFIVTPPNYAEDREYPLVLYWHGIGGDTELSGYRYMRDRLYESGHDCVLLAPIASRVEGQWWVNYQKAIGASPGTDAIYDLDEAPVTPAFLAACELLAEVVGEYPVETSRIYAVGVSMGGYASWEMMCRFPGIVSAAVPICGGCDPTKADVIADIPVWTYHGDCDTTVNINATRAMVQALQKAGNKNVHFTEYTGVDHGIWYKVFNDYVMWDWLFAQRRETAITPGMFQ